MRTHWNIPSPPRPDQLDLAQPVDWNCPQARGLIAYYPFWLAGSAYAACRSFTRRFPLDPAYHAYFPAAVADASFGRAQLFNDAANQFLYRAAPVTDYPFTLAAWFNTDDLSVYQTVASLSDPAGSAMIALLFLNTNGTVRAQSGTQVATTTTAAAAGMWNQATAVFSASASRSAFLNGGGKGTSTGTKALSGISHFNIARYTDAGSNWYQFSGRIGEVRLYNRALADGEAVGLWDPSTRWAMLRILTRRRVFVLPTVTTSPWFFRNFILRRGRYA